MCVKNCSFCLYCCTLWFITPAVQRPNGKLLVVCVFTAIKDELWLFLIPAGLALILLGVFLEEVGFLLRHSPSSRRRRLYLWILGMYPVTSASSSC